MNRNRNDSEPEGLGTGNNWNRNEPYAIRHIHTRYAIFIRDKPYLDAIFICNTPYSYAIRHTHTRYSYAIRHIHTRYAIFTRDIHTRYAIFIRVTPYPYAIHQWTRNGMNRNRYESEPLWTGTDMNRNRYEPIDIDSNWIDMNCLHSDLGSADPNVAYHLVFCPWYLFKNGWGHRDDGAKNGCKNAEWQGSPGCWPKFGAKFGPFFGDRWPFLVPDGPPLGPPGVSFNPLYLGPTLSRPPNPG